MQGQIIPTDSHSESKTWKPGGSINMNKGGTLIVMLMICAIMLAGCNTIHGMGKDIERLGHAMTKSADKK
jgi:predicted small secreted protein